MDLIAILSFAILVIIVLTLIFGVISYFLYKIREKKRNNKDDVINYEKLKEQSNREYLFFDEIKGNLDDIIEK